MNPMKTNIIPFITTIILILTPALLPAQDNPLLWRGQLETDHRLQTEGDNDWLWNENRIDLTFEKRAMPVRIVGNLWLRHLGPSIAENSSDLYLKDRINPWNLDIREAYVEVYGFLSDKLDLKVGRQQIAWGTGDQLNPTNNLNPPDLEDIFDFGRVRGTDAINLQWHFSHAVSLQTVFVPFFRPANLPLGAYADLLTIPVELPPDMQMQTYSDSLVNPRNSISESASYGARLRGFAFNTDLSLSYVYGRLHLPVPEHAVLTPVNMTGNIDVAATMTFPRHHILGADLAGSIGRVGVWAEAAVFFPERKINMTVESPMDTFVETMMEKKAYTKLLLGADYTFTNEIYINIQYLKGFLHEYGHGNLNDYLVLQTERWFRQNTLRIQPLAGGISIADCDEPADNYALFYTPEITYAGIDNLELSLGGYFFCGKGDNLFAGLKNLNMLRLHVRASF